MSPSNSDRTTLNKFAGNQLKNMRKQLGLTQPQLAEMLSFDSEKEIDKKTIYTWETGKVTVPAWAIQYVELLTREFADRAQGNELKDSSADFKATLTRSVIDKVKGWLKS